MYKRIGGKYYCYMAANVVVDDGGGGGGGGSTTTYTYYYNSSTTHSVYVNGTYRGTDSHAWKNNECTKCHTTRSYSYSDTAKHTITYKGTSRDGKTHTSSTTASHSWSDNTCTYCKVKRTTIKFEIKYSSKNGIDTYGGKQQSNSKTVYSKEAASTYKLSLTPWLVDDWSNSGQKASHGGDSKNVKYTLNYYNINGSLIDSYTHSVTGSYTAASDTLCKYKDGFVSASGTDYYWCNSSGSISDYGNEAGKVYTAIWKDWAAVTASANKTITYLAWYTNTKGTTASKAATLKTPPAVTGYTANGWKLNNTGTTYKAGTSFTCSGNSATTYKFYASYSAKTYPFQVSTNMYAGEDTYRNAGVNIYDSYGAVTSNGGKQANPTSFNATYKKVLPNFTSLPTNPAYNFKYYKLASSSDFKTNFVEDWKDIKLYSTGVSPGSTKVWEHTDFSKCWLIGIWEPKKFELRANTCGGNGWDDLPTNWTISADNSYASKQVYYNDPFSSLPTPRKEGYVFLGWSTKENSNNVNDKNISTNTKFTAIGTYNIYAIWKPGTKLIIKGNGGTWNDTEDELLVVLNIDKANEDCQVLTPNPKRNGWILDGYYLDSEGWHDPIYLWDSYKSTKYYGSDSEGYLGNGPYWDSKGIWRYRKTTELTAYAKWTKANSYVYYTDNSYHAVTPYCFDGTKWRLVTEIWACKDGTSWIEGV